MTEGSPKQVTFKVQRYDPENGSAPHWQEFTVPSSRGMTVLDGLLYIKENLDSTLAFRTSCRMGICGSCGMLINNYPHLACHTQIEELNSDTLTIKSLPNMPIIKDLVADLIPMFNVHKSIKPYIIRHDTAEMENLPAVCLLHKVRHMCFGLPNLSQRQAFPRAASYGSVLPLLR